MLYINWVIYIVINIYIFEGVKGYIYNFFKKTIVTWHILFY
jgi:hypothetical protein